MKKIAFILTLMTVSLLAKDNLIGSVNTAWKLLGKNDRIEVTAVNDPKIDGITCYLSYAKKGGASEIVGLEEDTSDASVSCEQTSQKIVIKEDISKEEDIFKKEVRCFLKRQE